MPISKNCKITLKVIWDQIKITCSKSDLRSDQDHDLEHHKKVITNQIVISDHSIIRSLNFLNTWVWITNEIFKKFAKHTFHTYTLSNIFFTSNFLKKLEICKKSLWIFPNFYKIFTWSGENSDLKFPITFRSRSQKKWSMIRSDHDLKLGPKSDLRSDQ